MSEAFEERSFGALGARAGTGLVLVALLLTLLLAPPLSAAAWALAGVAGFCEAARLRTALAWWYAPLVVLGAASLAALSFSPGVLLVLYLAVWGGDTTAYLFGTRFGRTPLAPRLSPKKSWEGLLAGFAVSLAVGVAAGRPGVGLTAGLLGPAGDLAESAVKRAAGVKDAGTFFGAHGGILDRFDALFAAAPVVWAVSAGGGT